MFKGKPQLTPDQFRWLRELRRSTRGALAVPQPVCGQLEALNYIQHRQGRAVMTSPGEHALRSYTGPVHP